MKLDAQSALALHKVNLELCFRLCDMFRHHGLRWSEARNHTLDVCATELEDVTTRMLEADDWNTLGFVASDLGWKALQHQNLFLQHFAQIAVASQADLMRQAQDAIATWQKDCAGALKESADMMTFSAVLQQLLGSAPQWLPAQPPVQARKPARRRDGG